MRGKKAQLSFYIITGMLAIIILLVLSNQPAPAPVEQTEQAAEALDLSLAAKTVRNRMNQCIEQELRDAVLFVAERGGYFSPPPDAVDFAAEDSPFVSTVPYFFVDRQKHIPSLDIVKNSIADYLAVTLPVCASNITLDGFVILLGNASFSVDMAVGSGLQNTLAASISLPTTIRSMADGDEITLESYAARIPTRIGEALAVSGSIINDTLPSFCLSCLSERTPPDMELFFFETAAPPYHVVVYQLLYSESSVSSSESSDSGLIPALFQFAAKYEEQPPLPTISFRDEEAMASVVATVGVPFSFRLKTTASNVPSTVYNSRFTDDTGLFDVIPSGAEAGMIRFTPRAEDVGMHLIEFRVATSAGVWDSALMQLKVKP